MINHINCLTNKIGMYSARKFLSYLMVLTFSGLIPLNGCATEVKPVVEEDPVDKVDQSFGRLVSLIRSPELKNALRKINSDSKAFGEAMRDPKGFFKSQSVQIDDDIEVTVTKGSKIACFKISGVYVCYTFP